MSQLGCVCLWALALLGSPVMLHQLPDITERNFIEECVQAHNVHRSSVSPPAADMLYMTWDAALAKSARAWARSCKFSHNPLLQSPGRMHPNFSPVGENIWVGNTPIFSASSAISAWNAEFESYSYSSMMCSKVCGHYTQVVWAKSYKVGCAAHRCLKVEGFRRNHAVLFVCNYGVAGNMKGVQPYTQGDGCSGCHGDTCQDKLCRNPKRDKDTSYDWAPDWDSGDPSKASSVTGLCLVHMLLLVVILHSYNLTS